MIRGYRALIVLIGYFFGSVSSSSNSNNSIAQLGATTVLIDDGGCLGLCQSTNSCANDPNFHGSYCKFWQSPAVCFGLYTSGNFTNQTENGTVSNSSSNVCFQPNDSLCDDAILAPVTCPAQTNTSCTLLCSQTPSCVSDANKGGSYCKTDSDTCFGLYWTDSTFSSACFQPNDPSCPSSFPVSCTSTEISVFTTASPENSNTTVSPTIAPGSTTIASTTESPTTSTESSTTTSTLSPTTTTATVV